MITASDSQVLISGTHSMCSPPLMNGSSFSCRAWNTSFTPMKAEDHRQAVVQVDQPVHQAAEQEVELAQAHQREDVRGEDDERALGDAEDRRDGVDREHQVRHADGDEDDDHRGEQALAVHRGAQLAAVVVLVIGRTLRSRRDEPVLGLVFLVLAGVRMACFQAVQSRNAPKM